MIFKTLDLHPKHVNTKTFSAVYSFVALDISFAFFGAGFSYLKTKITVTTPNAYCKD